MRPGRLSCVAAATSSSIALALDILAFSRVDCIIICDTSQVSLARVSHSMPKSLVGSRRHNISGSYEP